ncbi:MAG: protein kinase, partial [Phycisphaeraceae bacterium]|nr:protein kinase [Phycisphaeraceae bacterium]
ALALMDHPNIAKVFAAGATDTGRPYFVMELVQGVSVTEYCDQNNLSTKERLALFIQICNAVQHAHQKGIIHRDIKPTNVMVTQRDGMPVPKVIDFGIAKATNQRLTEKTLFTRYARIIGTPAYMSPEQAELSDVDIDTRSDVYSLGVLLYELLTGTQPFSEEELRKAGYIEMQRIIHEEEPTKPSTKLSTLGKTLTEVAKHHGATPDLLRKAVCGDLDWIVMKTLEKARDRRYDTVSGLTMDVERHLKDEPILARAPGTVYCLRKFYCRHQFQVLASLIVSVLVVTLLAAFLVWNYKKHLLQAESSMMHRIILNSALNSLWDHDPGTALADLEPILDSKSVGPELRNVTRFQYDLTLRAVRNRVNVSTAEIEANPGDAKNYLVRAQEYYWLGQTEKMIADMLAHVNILNPLDEATPHDLRFRDFLIGLWRSSPTNLGQPVSSFGHDCMGGITPDGLSLILDSNRSSPTFNLWMTKRATTGHNWGTPQKLAEPINTGFFDGGASLSPDGLSLYFNSGRPSRYNKEDGKNRSHDIYLSTRRTLHDSWGTPVLLAEPINSVSYDITSSLSADGLELYFASGQQDPNGEVDLWVTRRLAVSDPWGDPKNLGPTVNSRYLDFGQHIWADGLILFITSDRPGGYGDRDIWVTTRKTKDDDWGTPVNLGPTINSSGKDQQPFIRADGSTLYFSSERPGVGVCGALDIWKVQFTQMSGGFQESDDINPTQKSIQGKN